MLAMNTKKFSAEQMSFWARTYATCQLPIECTCECGQNLSNINSIFNHRKTNKHRNLMEKSDKETIQNRHNALPDYVKKSSALYVPTKCCS